MSEGASEAPHSAAHFNEQRDFWWNADYLQLLGRRLGLGDCRDVLDVGCGVGHWGRLLLPMLDGDARLTGVDPETLWVQRARQAAEHVGIAGRCRYEQGAAEQLPFADATFDLVTCQTVLIHVADVGVALAEMMRVLRPGGLLVAAEPNNLAGTLVLDSISETASIAELLERVEFALICERGKQALGQGNSSVGDLLPEMFLRVGLTAIEAFLNDKTFSLWPPYASPDQQALRSAMLSNAQARRWTSPQDETRRHFVAGGGFENEFDQRWNLRLEETQREAHDLLAGHFSSAGGGLQYVVAGRRPR
jgi:ubiquinone/menaquinone biosynthesis C-methylase UbiE